MALIRNKYQPLCSYGIDANVLPSEWKWRGWESEPSKREILSLMKNLPSKTTWKEKENVWMEMRKRQERHRKEAVKGLNTYQVDHFMAPP